MIGRKRELTLVVLLLGAATSAASEGMRILTFVPGVANGRLPIVVDLGSSRPPAELLQNGRHACAVAAVHQTCVVDLGLSPRVTLLELVRRDGSGRVVETARRWVNKPSDARAEVLARSDCTHANEACTLTFSWSHENAAAPRALLVTIDGRKVYDGEPKDVAMPPARGSAARIVSVELSFEDGERATRTLLVGSGVSSAVDAPLNAVPVLPHGPAARDPARLEMLGGRRVHSVEPGEREVLFVVAPSAIAKLKALTEESQKPFSRSAGRMHRLLEGVDHVVFFSAVATRGAFSTASRVSDRMYRLQGYDCTPKNDYRERTLALPCVDQNLLTGERYRLAATVASAAYVRAAVPRRRTVVVVLGDEETASDESPYGAADARRYLADLLVPVEVWRLGSAAARDWPEGRRLSGAEDLVRGWEALRAGLDAQRLCWIAEDLDPAAFRLAPEDQGLALAGRGETAAPLAVASGEETGESGTITRAPVPAEASKKSVSASQEVALVNLEAFVTDRKGRRVPGLAAADFTLKVGGKVVAITNFSEFRPPRSATASAEPSPARPKRRVVLFVDRLTLGDARRSAVFFGSLKDFVVRTVQPGDEAAVLTFDETLATSVPFTGDASKVLQALDRLAKESARPPAAFAGTESAERLVDEFEQAEREIAQRDANIRRGAAAPPPPPREAVAPQTAPINPTVLAEARGLAAQEWARIRRKAAAVRSILVALGGMDGRRLLVVASHRLSRYTGLEHFLSKRLDRDVFVPQEAHEFDARELLVSLAQAANSYGVMLHGLYPEAGGDFDLSVVQRTTPQFTGQAMNGRRGIWIDANESDGLHLAVDDTGGLVGLGAERAADALSGAAEDLESYYSLGFPVEGLAGGKPLAVELKVSAPGAAVRTRRTVARRSAADRVADRAVSNLFSRDPASRLPLEARVTSTSPEAKGRLKVAYEVTIPASSLGIFPDSGGRVAKIAAFVALLDGGDVTQAPPVSREFRTGEDAFADAAGRFVFAGEAVVAPGSTISIGILDEATQEAGFERIDVPGPATR